MASRDYVESLINSLPAEEQPVLKQIFTEILTQLRFGHATAGEPAMNFAGNFLEGKTAAVANAEFRVVHGLGSAPYLFVPVLPLDATNAVLPELHVTRPADDMYIYLSSPVVGATFVFLVEG